MGYWAGTWAIWRDCRVIALRAVEPTCCGGRNPRRSSFVPWLLATWRVWLVRGGLGGPHVGLSTAVAVALNCGARYARQLCAPCKLPVLLLFAPALCLWGWRADVRQCSLSCRSSRLQVHLPQQKGTCHLPYPVRAIRRTSRASCRERGGPSRKRGWP